jgi:hypothetical protein
VFFLVDVRLLIALWLLQGHQQRGAAPHSHRPHHPLLGHREGWFQEGQECGRGRHCPQGMAVSGPHGEPAAGAAGTLCCYWPHWHGWYMVHTHLISLPMNATRPPVCDYVGNYAAGRGEWCCDGCLRNCRQMKYLFTWRFLLPPCSSAFGYDFSWCLPRLDILIWYSKLCYAEIPKCHVNIGGINSMTWLLYNIFSDFHQKWLSNIFNSCIHLLLLCQIHYWFSCIMQIVA